MAEHAVIFRLIPGEGFNADALDRSLVTAAGTINAEYDGWELAVDGSEANFYLYGEDADALFEVAAPVVRRAEIGPGSHAVKRYGDAADPSAPEERIELR